jgi:hypothetical protein
MIANIPWLQFSLDYGKKYCSWDIVWGLNQKVLITLTEGLRGWVQRSVHDIFTTTLKCCSTWYWCILYNKTTVKSVSVPSTSECVICLTTVKQITQYDLIHESLLRPYLKNALRISVLTVTKEGHHMNTDIHYIYSATESIQLHDRLPALFWTLWATPAKTQVTILPSSSTVYPSHHLLRHPASHYNNDSPYKNSQEETRDAIEIRMEYCKIQNQRIH